MIPNMTNYRIAMYVRTYSFTCVFFHFIMFTFDKFYINHSTNFHTVDLEFFAYPNIVLSNFRCV